jgi:hypothetical protein
MKHVGADRLADLARGLAGSTERVEIESHLSVCDRCRRAAEVLGGLHKAARAEVEYEPPRDVLQRAIGVYQPPQPGNVTKLTRIVAQLVYDSFRDPVPVGIRTADRPSQALYDAGDYSLHLQLSRVRHGRERSTSTMVLMGQISNRVHPRGRLANIPVLLLCGDDVSLRGVTNELGEFDFEYDPKARMRLLVSVGGGMGIEVPLPRPNSSREARWRRRGGNMGKTLAFGLLCCALWAPASAGPQKRFILRAQPDDVTTICQTHGLRPVRELGRPGFVLVEPRGARSASRVEAGLKSDPRVADVEPDDMARPLEVRPQSEARQSLAAAGDLLFDRTAIEFFGEWAWVGFVEQPAGRLIGVPEVHEDRQAGRGVTVAVIDTGVDPDHPVLAGSLVSGYDFTRDLTGAASEWPDLPPAAAALLEQSTAAILDQSTAAILDGSTAVILNQSTAAILDSATAEALAETESVPSAFGHGTMVAGLIHLVAPEARIMPLKAFRADGFSRPSDIIRAIFYAVDRGAKVINMSFSLESAPRGVKWAVAYATLRGVICVASAGNEAKQAQVYPAALLPVMGVAATTMQDTRAPFSNFGEGLVTLAAPGVDLITTYPGSRYAAVSGTSFSTALVSGATAILAGVDPHMRLRAADAAFESSWFISEDLGHGRIDISAAVAELEERSRAWWR